MIKYNNKTINDWYFDDKNIIKVYKNNAICYYRIVSGGVTPPAPSYDEQYLTIESTSNNNTISWKSSRTSLLTTISASTDNGVTWTEYTATTNSGTTLATLNTGDKLLIKGENSHYATSGFRSTKNFFSSTDTFEVKGNVMSMISGDTFADADTLTEDYALEGIFSGCTHLTSAENLILPAIALGRSCYQSMFQGCTSLTTAPELPCMNLNWYCYDKMFQGCTSLTTAPELPATTLASQCYSYMFEGCTNLTTAPELPATTLAQGCYTSMFGGCTSLTTAPELPALNLVYGCYSYMFEGCTNLTTAPELPATTLANYCYRNMFGGCTSLNYIKCLATNISATQCTYNWVDGVASTGTFVKKASMTSWATGSNGIPSGWTIVNA